jgi:hypothetical protein
MQSGIFRVFARPSMQLEILPISTAFRGSADEKK